MSQEHDRVRTSTSSDAQAELDAARLAAVAALVAATPERIAERIDELDREWDVERVLTANASTLTLAGVALSVVHDRRWLALSAVVPASLLQHALQGWCPPLVLIRRLGVRTRSEIDTERTAVKALRGDFGAVWADPSDPAASAQRALEAAVRS